ncbi:unnamed protein product [Soboliphyme baturini]|uniref:Cadherin-89D n=1 Tax=Soboliphyme baturini TaxID=241478 RepID=A0A183I9C0_9BILA|nr:unnamed protein product [Soboliphyme baturini]
MPTLTLSFTEGKTLSFYVKACDKGNPPLYDEVPVMIDIVPRRPTQPLFLQNNPVLRIGENAEVGTLVGHLRFTSYPQYSAEIVNDRHRRIKQNFNLHPNGSFYVAGPLNREVTPFYRFYVALRDAAAGSSASPYVAMTSVTVILQDVNDNIPSFGTENLKLFLPEDIAVGAAVFKVHADDADVEDAGRVTYSFHGQSGPFRIEADSGWIFSTARLNRERVDRYSLNITAADSGTPPLKSVLRLLIVVLDVNDEVPHFDRSVYNFSVDDRTPVGTIVGAVHATDNDLPPNNQLTYYIMEGNMESGCFTSDADFDNSTRKTTNRICRLNIY